MLDKLLEVINSILIDSNRKLLSVLTPQMSLRNDIGFDSLDLAKLTVIIEDKYNVDIFMDGVVDKIGEVLERIEK
jgi:acyl carrier protein